MDEEQPLRAGAEPSTEAPTSLNDVHKLLRCLTAELSALRQSHTADIQTLRQTQSSLQSTLQTVISNQRQLLSEVEKLRNPTKKHYTRLSNLPVEIVRQIMLWIHPQAIWKLRALSKLFRDMISSKSFAVQNLRRFVRSANPTFTVSKCVRKNDRIFFRAPKHYQMEYSNRALCHLTTLVWSHKLPHDLPRFWFQSLSNLKVLRLSDCMLTGKIPSEIEELTSLEELQLSGNDFEGEIPESLGNLVQLRFLRLYNNPELCGVLSIAFGKLKLLEAIEIHNTAIMGPIPVEICSLENLKRLDLSLQLNPDIPNVIPVEIASLSQLEELNLSECNLVGSIPQGLGQLPQLRVLLLNINNLSGEVPMDLNFRGLADCFLNDNQALTFSFVVPDHWSV